MAEEKGAVQENTETAKPNESPAADSTEVAEKLFDKSEDEAKGESTETEEKESKPKEEEPKETVAEGAPEKYSLKLAEKGNLNEADIEWIEGVARELDLNNEEAQDYVEFADRVATNVVDRMNRHVEKVRSDWAEQSKKDKEIGGDKFTESSELSMRVLDKFGNDDLKKMLDETGFKHHPEVKRFLTRIGKLMKADEAVFAGSQKPGEKRPEDVFYPSNVAANQ